MDEVFAIVPVSGDNGFKILLGDLELGMQLIRDEIGQCDEWLLEDPDNLELVEYANTLSDWIHPYSNPTNAVKIEEVDSNLDAIRDLLTSSLSLNQEDVLIIPVLFPLRGVVESGWGVQGNSLPNAINMVVLENELGTSKILVPSPGFGFYEDEIKRVLGILQYAESDISFVDTSGPHGLQGEAHCATNVERKRSP